MVITRNKVEFSNQKFLEFLKNNKDSKAWCVDPYKCILAEFLNENNEDKEIKFAVGHSAINCSSREVHYPLSIWSEEIPHTSLSFLIVVTFDALSYEVNRDIITFGQFLKTAELITKIVKKLPRQYKLPLPSANYDYRHGELMEIYYSKIKPLLPQLAKDIIDGN